MRHIISKTTSTPARSVHLREQDVQQLVGPDGWLGELAEVKTVLRFLARNPQHLEE